MCIIAIAVLLTLASCSEKDGSSTLVGPSNLQEFSALFEFTRSYHTWFMEPPGNGKRNENVLTEENELHLYEFHLKASRLVEYVLDCEDDCRMSIWSIAGIGNVLEENDDDKDSPIEGYDDRSSGGIRLGAGDYVLLVYQFNRSDDNRYQLQLDW
jgi:hypothetical protein